jgi:hypothetical protein
MIGYRRTPSGDRFFAALMTVGIADPEVLEFVDDVRAQLPGSTTEEILHSLRRMLQLCPSMKGTS